MIRYYCDICKKEVLNRNTRAPGRLEKVIEIREMQFQISVDVRSPTATENDALCDSCKIAAIETLLLEVSKEGKSNTPDIPDGL